MKKIILIITICLMALQVNSQDIPVPGHITTPGDPPPGVEELFLRAFPGATFINWHIGDHNLVAEFMMNDLQYYARYTPEGRQVELIRPITVYEMPLVVREAINQGRYHNWHVENVTRVHLPGDEVFYRYRLSLDERVISVEVDDEGQILDVGDW